MPRLSHYSLRKDSKKFVRVGECQLNFLFVLHFIVGEYAVQFIWGGWVRASAFLAPIVCYYTHPQATF